MIVLVETYNTDGYDFYDETFYKIFGPYRFTPWEYVGEDCQGYRVWLN